MRAIRFPLVLLLVCACASVSDFETARVRAHSVSAVGPLVHALEAELERSAAVTVEYWTEGAARLRVVAQPAQTHRILLPRLRASRTYTYNIVGTSVTGTFTTAALPDDLSRIQLVTTGTPTTPLALLHLYDPTGFRGYVAIDDDGEVVWYFRTADVAFGAARRANGNFVFMDKGRGLLEVGVDGTVVHELAQDTVNREQHHDVIASPRNTLLFIAFDRRLHAGTELKGEAIWEWRPEAGTVERRWTSWDHFSPDQDRGPRFGGEWLHANSLAMGQRGNVLMSVHYFNQIISISPDWQRVEWRLGGVNATTAVTASDQFSGQHTAHELGSNRLLLFDNNIEPGDASRAIEFDLSGNTVRSVWEWKPVRRNLAMAVGSARRLANGNTVIAFGMSAGLSGSTGPVELYEVDANGQTVWHVEVRNAWLMYRAEPFASVGLEQAAGS